jgi:hypothetical protein
MLTSGRRHGWFQVAFVTGVLALLMATDRNGDLLARAAIGLTALGAFVYAVLRLWRDDEHSTDRTIVPPTALRHSLVGRSPVDPDVERKPAHL